MREYRKVSSTNAVPLEDFSSTPNLLDKVAVPDWSEYFVESLETKMIPCEHVFVDDLSSNVTKVVTHTSPEIEALQQSFSNGVNLNEFPPAVVYVGPNANKHNKPYKLVYGYGRSEALSNLHTKEWVFTVLKGSTNALQDVMAVENEGYPKRFNEERDMVKFIASKVTRELDPIKNTKAAIKYEVNRIYGKYRNGTVRGRVINAVMERVNTDVPFAEYPSIARVNQWIDNHSLINYTTGGEFNEDTGCFGVVVGYGYAERAIFQAIRRYLKTGNFTDVIGHVKHPTKNISLDMRREQYLQGWRNLEAQLRGVGCDVFPINFVGFLPQCKRTEDFQNLVEHKSIIDFVQKSTF